MTEVENTIPVLPVTSLSRSIAFYVEKLGFTLDWGSESDGICSVSRDGHCIMLDEVVSVEAPSCVWIGLETDNLFSVFLAAGVRVLQHPENNPWAYDMKILDPDGNILWFATAPV